MNPSARAAFLVFGAALVFGVPSAPAVQVPRYSGTITVTARESGPGGGMYSAYVYEGTARLRFSFSGSGFLRDTPRRTAPIRGSYSTTHGTSDYRLCKGPDESGALSGTIVYSFSPVVRGGTVTFAFTDLGETMTPNWHTVCGLPQAQAGGPRTMGLLGYAIQAAEGKALKFTMAARGGTLLRKGTLRNAVPSDRTQRTYVVTVELKKVA